MNRPKLLDLFCCAGGAGEGYRRAGYDVIGVDIEKHPRNPAPMIVRDAMETLRDRRFLAQFDVIHASPPCQAYSITKHTHSVQHPDLYWPVREALVRWAEDTGGSWVIENVPGVPMNDYTVLCGTMFDLRATDTDGTPLALRRHRWFESNRLLLAPGPCRHDGTQVGGVYGGGSADRDWAKNVRRGGYTPAIPIRRQLMGIEWMTARELSQAIPPAYTQHIGEQLNTAA